MAREPASKPHALRSRPPFTGVPRGPRRKLPHRVLFDCFCAPGSECPTECFLIVFWRFWAQKAPKNTQKALFGALRARCSKALKKQFPARAPGHSCKWRPGSQPIRAHDPLRICEFLAKKTWPNSLWIVGPHGVLINLFRSAAEKRGLWEGVIQELLRRALFCVFLTPDIPQSEIAATNFFDRAKSWAKNWAKNWAKFWTKFSGHFRASFTVQNDPPKFLPKFLSIYHSMSCHGSCD